MSWTYLANSNLLRSGQHIYIEPKGSEMECISGVNFKILAAPEKVPEDRAQVAGEVGGLKLSRSRSDLCPLSSLQRTSLLESSASSDATVPTACERKPIGCSLPPLQPKVTKHGMWTRSPRHGRSSSLDFLEGRTDLMVRSSYVNEMSGEIPKLDYWPSSRMDPLPVFWEGRMPILTADSLGSAHKLPSCTTDKNCGTGPLPRKLLQDMRTQPVRCNGGSGSEEKAGDAESRPLISPLPARMVPGWHGPIGACL